MEHVEMTERQQECWRALERCVWCSESDPAPGSDHAELWEVVASVKEEVTRP
jgi:hypothetical protein